MNLLLSWYRDRGLLFRLLVVMMVLFACSLGSVFIPYHLGRENLKDDLEKSFLDLSNAIRVSVDQLTAPAESEEDRLHKYVESLKKSGIREVSIVDQDLGVIDSTNPGKIGKTARIRLPREKLVINAVFGENPGEGEKVTTRDLVVPVTVAGDTLGLIHVRMQIEDFTDTIRRNVYVRFVSTLLIFFLGFALAVSVAFHYVRPLERLAQAAERVAAGDLSQELPVPGRDEVGRLTRSFNDMVARLRSNRELEEKVRESQYLTQLGRLASGMAHEIRNPLNFMRLAIDHLGEITRSRTEAEEEERSRILARVREEIGKLNGLVTDFVSYGRPAVPQRVPISVPEVMESVLRTAGERARAQGIRISSEYRESPPIPVDPDMLRRALLNVVANAIDAMPEGGYLRATGEPLSDGGYRVTIGDTGAGIPEGDRERVFEPYFTTKSTGLGLGLGLVRKVAEAHGGTVVIESEPGKETRISILLPGSGHS